MHTQPISNVIYIDQKSAKQVKEPVCPQPLLVLSAAEVRQQLLMQLQSSLDLRTVLTLFFNTSQRLVAFDSLSFNHSTHNETVALGANSTHHIQYTLNYQTEFLGEITFTRAQRFDDIELSNLESIMSSLVLPLRNALLYSTALHNAMKDPLTGAGNRISMQSTLERDIAIAQRHNQALSVLMVDIDYFKRINDIYGHSTGDTVLVNVAHTLQKQLRNSDSLFRYGGEEFLVVLPNTCSLDAAVVAERLRASLEALQISNEQGVISVTASIGCAALKAQESLNSVLQRSDAALYAAKNKGRNQVSYAS